MSGSWGPATVQCQQLLHTTHRRMSILTVAAELQRRLYVEINTVCRGHIGPSRSSCIRRPNDANFLSCFYSVTLLSLYEHFHLISTTPIYLLMSGTATRKNDWNTCTVSPDLQRQFIDDALCTESDVVEDGSSASADVEVELPVKPGHAPSSHREPTSVRRVTPRRSLRTGSLPASP